MLKKSLCNIARNLVVKLGFKPLFLPAYKFTQHRKLEKLMKRYDPENTLYGLNTEKRGYELTVSFTTYPARINAAVYVADAMLSQTLKPDRVILVLASDEFESKADLPKDYEQLEKRGLTIVFIQENLKAHNKYRHAMLNYPDSLIVTVDDDILYPDNLLETLVDSYIRYPNVISARRAHRILFKDGKLLPYNEWEGESEYTDKPALDLIATGVSGVLYPPNCFSKFADLFFNSDVVKKYALPNDDIWLKFIALKCHISVVVSGEQPQCLPTVPDSQGTALYYTNVGEMRNDAVMRNCMSLFGLNDEDFQALLLRR